MAGIQEYLIIMLLVSVIAGLVGSLVGVGGGILVVPVLSLVFGVPVHFAVGASIISTIATSSGSASAYVSDRITNLRIGMFLETGTTVGAVVGAITTLSLVRTGLGWVVFVAFGVLLLFSAYGVVSGMRAERASKASGLTEIRVERQSGLSSGENTSIPLSARRSSTRRSGFRPGSA